LQAVAGDVKEEEAELARGSSEHERWCDGRRRWRRLKLGSRAGESGEEVRWWLDILRCLYRGPGRAEKAAMGCNQ
jgi:hypothetical protein